MSWMLINRLTKCRHAYKWHDWWCYVRDMYNENCITLGEIILNTCDSWSRWATTGCSTLGRDQYLSHSLRWVSWHTGRPGIQSTWALRNACSVYVVGEWYPLHGSYLFYSLVIKILYHNCETESWILAMTCYRTCNLMASFLLKMIMPWLHCKVWTDSIFIFENLYLPRSCWAKCSEKITDMDREMWRQLLT